MSLINVLIGAIQLVHQCNEWHIETCFKYIYSTIYTWKYNHYHNWYSSLSDGMFFSSCFA